MVRNRDLRFKIGIVLGIVIFLIVAFFVLYYFKITFTGNAIFSLPEALPGKILQGTFDFAPEEIAETIPSNALVAVSYGGSLKTLPLSRVLPSSYLSAYSQSGLIFRPTVEITIEYIPKDYYDQLPGGGFQDHGSVSSGAGASGGSQGGSNAGGGLTGFAVSGSDKSFFRTIFIKYGTSANLASYEGYVPVLSSVKVRDTQLNPSYATLSRSAQGLVVSTSYYESLGGIVNNAPETSIDLSAFRFIAGQSGQITLSIVYLGETLFSESTQANIKNVPTHNFDTSNHVLVNPRDIPTEVTVEGDVAPHTIAVGPVITPDLISVGCKSYICDIAAPCATPSLDAINKGVLVPVQKITCRYTDCKLSFQITQSCDVPVSDVDVARVVPQDLGISSGGSFGSSVALLRSDTKQPVAAITTHKNSSKVDITFLQSPPSLGDHCKNGLLDDGETAVDCGGSCMACLSTRPDYSLIVVWLGTCLLGFLFFVYLFKS